MDERAMDEALGDRIYDQTVAKVYSEWKERGLLRETATMLVQLPPELRSLLIYSFTTHVHKEKGLFIDIIGEQMGVSDTPRHAVAASADLLWSLSLMVDDIEDGDLVRGGQESCWVKHGKSDTVEAVKQGLTTVVKHLDISTGNPLVGKSCLSYVNLGMESLFLHKQMDLSTPLGVVMRNYEQRCDFHGTFPLIALSEVVFPGKRSEVFKQAVIGLRCLNRGGQLINDLKDIVNGDVYNRSFSDLRNGVVTVPLLELNQSLSSTGSRILKSVFGKRKLTEQDQQELLVMVEGSGLKYKVWKRVEGSYAEGLDSLGACLDQFQLFWFATWADYKLNAAKQQLGI